MPPQWDDLETRKISDYVTSLEKLLELMVHAGTLGQPSTAAVVNPSREAELLAYITLLEKTQLQWQSAVVPDPPPGPLTSWSARIRAAVKALRGR